MPSFIQMGKALIQICTPDTNHHIWLWDDVKATFGIYFLGMVISVITATVCGILMGCYKWIEHFLILPLSFSTRVIATAMLAVFFVVFGTDTTFFLAMIVFGVTPILTLTIYQSTKYDIKEDMINKGYTLGASNCEVIYEIIFMQILPRIIDATRLQVGPALVFLIAAEFYAANIGFGYRLKMQGRMTNMDVVYDYILVLCLIGYLIDFSLLKLRKTVSPWFGGDDK
jgi:NitT/TauT family transport system permease protein